MTSLAAEVDRALTELRPKARGEFEQTVRHALEDAKRRSAWEGVPTDEKGYPLGYFEETAGCFANEPFDEPVELPLPPAKVW